MKNLNKGSMLAMGASFAVMASLMPTTSFAQSGEDSFQDEIITIGTRRKARSAADAPAPIDVISGAEFTGQASNDISDLLRVAVPSYNVNTQPISDGGTLVRPANLRGLSPDNTLVLLNGKRRHRAAVISFLGGGIADGAQGPDVSVFPALALKQVEVLRDGASSQYGADAIAGVLNFVLKDASEGGSATVKYGSTFEGDGDNIQLSANIGLPLGDKGFVNVTGEWQESDGTFRSVQRDDALALIAAGNTAVTDISVNTVTSDVVQYWGQPDVEDDFKIFVNTGLEVGENTEVYAFGNYASRRATGGFFFRNPVDRDGVFTGPTVDPITGAASTADNAVASVLVGDETGNLSGNCPAGIPLTGNAGLIPDPVILAQIIADDNCFSFIEQFPGGFTPRFGGDLEDFSVVGGVRGQIDFGTGLNYDISASLGHNEADFFISNTINASLGSQSPTSFDPGGYTQEEVRVGIDLSYDLPIQAFASDLTIATGAEWRREEFIIEQGETASFNSAATDSAVTTSLLQQGFAPGSNGFGGFSPNAAGSFDQSNVALYGELEADVTEQVTLQGAVRWEDFDTFGSTFNWKVGGLYKFNDILRLRGTYSTGFHAPTPGQANVTNVSTAFGPNGLEDQGILPVTSAPAQLVTPGAELGPEEARNISVGFGLDTFLGNLTLDYFNITVDGRIAPLQAVDFTDTLTALANANGVALPDLANTNNLLVALNAANVLDINDFAGFEGTANFSTFGNDFDTRTQGIDLVYNYPFEFSGGDSRLTVVGNWSDTEVTSAGNLGPGRIISLEDNIPNFKGNATWSHREGIFSGYLRANYFGAYLEDHLDAGGDLIIDNGAEITLDAEITATVYEGLDLTIGAQNFLDNFPDENPFSGIVGARFAPTSPFGFNGGQYYVKASYTF